MNLQESIRKILREETIDITTILRRIPLDDLEREFEESLDMASNIMLRIIKKDGKKDMNLKIFIEITISVLIDGIHSELISTLPGDVQWYDEVKEALKEHYKNRIKVKYKKLMPEL
jgi:hypothetical protein